jgi:putative phosphoesterase
MDELALREELPARLVVEADGLRFGLVHSGGARAGRHRRLRAWFPGCDVVGYGHSHEPEVARWDDLWILNPGSLTDRRRAPSRTMIVVREGKPELVESARRRRHPLLCRPTSGRAGVLVQFRRLDTNIRSL